MAEFPALPIFTDAYMADTRHLTATQHGAYLLLLMTAWRMPDCALPDDNQFLARCASIDPRGWASIKTIVMAFWRMNPEGKWVQNRLLDERRFAEARADHASKAGRASALKRKKRHSTRVQPNVNPSSTTLPLPSTSTNVEGVPPSITGLLFGPALQYLVKNSGLPEKECRSLIGKWKKESGEDSTLKALRQSQKEEASQPIEYISRILKPKERYTEKKSNVRTIK